MTALPTDGELDRLLKAGLKMERSAANSLKPFIFHVYYMEYAFLATLDVTTIGARLKATSWVPSASKRLILGKMDDCITHRTD